MEIDTKTDKNHTIPNRATKSFWIDPEIYARFLENCHKTHRQTCDIIEPWMEAYNRIVENLPNSEEICPMKPFIVKIETLKIEALYASRGRGKPTNDGVFCKRTMNSMPKWYCKQNCKYGKNYALYKETPCETYLTL